MLADQVRSQDWRARRAKFAVQATPQTVAEVQGRFGVLMFPGLPEATTSGHVVSLLEAIDGVASTFELVFDNDWPTTLTNIGEAEHLVDRNTTFLRSLLPDEDNNWANHRALLGAYWHLLQCMQDCGMRRKPLK